jgi:intracellular multiplication protein IcmE
MSEDEIKPVAESDAFGGEDTFDDFESGEGQSLGGIMKSPTVKVGVIVVGVVSVVAALVLFGGKTKDTGWSMLRASNSEVDQAPGTSDISPAMKNAIEDVNKKNAEIAERQDGSAIPIPVQPMSDRVKLSESNDAMPEDPLERWRRIQEERQKRQDTGKAEKQVDPNAEAIDNLAKAISAQMGQILKAQKLKGMEYDEIADGDLLEKKREEQRKKREEELEKQQSQDAANGNSKVLDILVPAGTIEYAQLITEANSDMPGPVLAQILTGRLAGSRVLGSFKAKDEYLIISFDVVVIDGISTPMDGVALDPDTTRIGMVTDIDHKYFTRVILPAAAKFVEGMSSAIADSGSTSVTVNNGTAIETENDLGTREEAFKGVAEGVSKISEVLDEDGKNTKPLVRVASGTPIAVLFVEPVTEPAKKK